jgi:hypothetical protein
MRNSRSVFRENIRLTREIGSLHDYLTTNVVGPISFDDLLRSQIVYAVSAFDKLMHDLIRIGMVDILIGKRLATPKYLNEKIPLSVVNQMAASTIPPKEIIFEQYIVSRLKILSYQDPDNVADGLSYIWSEQHKWQKIAVAMGKDETAVRTELRLVISRRNAIVHEADIDLATGKKLSITKADCENSISFLESCGEQIVALVL